MIGIACLLTCVSCKATPVEGFLETFEDFILATIGILLPDPFYVNQSISGESINFRKFYIHGLKHLKHNCVFEADMSTTAEQYYFKTKICIAFGNHFSVDGLLQMCTLLYDTDYEKARLEILGLEIDVGLTLSFPRKFNKEVGIGVMPGLITDVRMTGINVVPEDENTVLAELGDMVNMFSFGPIGGYIEAMMAKSIKKAFKRFIGKVSVI